MGNQKSNIYFNSKNIVFLIDKDQKKNIKLKTIIFNKILYLNWKNKTNKVLVKINKQIKVLMTTK